MYGRSRELRFAKRQALYRTRVAGELCSSGSSGWDYSILLKERGGWVGSVNRKACRLFQQKNGIDRWNDFAHRICHLNPRVRVVCFRLAVTYDQLRYKSREKRYLLILVHPLPNVRLSERKFVARFFKQKQRAPLFYTDER
jgi:hypothetical protein